MKAVDHILHASQDLDALADIYRRLGFNVGRRNRHDWGTLNHIVQLEGSFLELIGLEDGFRQPSVGSPEEPFAAFLSQYLDQREGFAMAVRQTNAAEQDHAEWTAAGYGVGSMLNFGRSGAGPDGREVKVAFSLAFATSERMQNAGFFACQHHHPENFWSDAAKTHPNTAQSLALMVLAASDPGRSAEFLSAWSGDSAPVKTSDALVFRMRGCDLVVMTPARARQTYGIADLADDEPGRFVAYHVRCTDTVAAQSLIVDNGFDTVVADGRFQVGGPAVRSVTIVFEGMTPARG